ncbi:MAG: BtrH N-terminal domain-containing protein [Candidatus Lokiarchaeota archaeon]
MTQKIIVNNFVHRVGAHCESSAMRDLFEFYGFNMSEAMAFGLDATLGFGFFDTTESVSFIPESKIPFSFLDLLFNHSNCTYSNRCHS